MTTKEAAQVVDIPHQTVSYWLRQGLLRPAGALRGRRNPAEWSPKDLHELRTLVRLRAAGLSLQGLREATGFLRNELHHNPLSSGQFFVFGTARGKPTHLVKVCAGGEAIECLRDGRGQMVMPVLDPAEKLVADSAAEGGHTGE